MRQVWLLAAKDLRVEWSNRGRIQSLLLLGAALAAVASYGWRGRPDLPSVLPTLAWLIAVLLQLFFLSQTYQAEVENACFEGLRLSPAPRWALALGKMLSGWLLVAVAGLVTLALLALLTTSLAPLHPALLALLGLETLGLVAVGNLLFACTAAGEPPGLDLHALVLLLGAPLLFLGLDTSNLALAGASLPDLAGQSALLAAYTGVLVTVSTLLYGPVAEGRG